MSKILKAFITLIAATLVLFAGIGATYTAYADTDEPPADTVVDTDTEENTAGLEAIAERFKEYLKAQYGADYEYYYKQIIENWGSVEAYLLSFGEKLPEEYQTGWDKFVGWLGEYSVIWAPPLAVVIVILVAVTGKKQFNKIIDRIVNTKLSPLVSELNLQSEAMVATMNAQKALLGNNEKFADNVKELEKCERELKNE